MLTGAGGAPDGSGAKAPRRWKERPPQVQGGASASRELTAPSLFPQRPAGPPPPPGRGPRGRKEESGRRLEARAGLDLPQGGRPLVAGMSFGEHDGRGRAPELQVEAEEVHRARGERLWGGCKRVGRSVGV